MYPFGLRFDSSNPDPFLAWAHGFQLAALNFQGQDRQLWIAQALFQQNGRCGYVRKPQYLLPGNDSNMVNMDPKLLLTASKILSKTYIDNIKPPWMVMCLFLIGVCFLCSGEGPHGK